MNFYFSGNHQLIWWGLEDHGSITASKVLYKSAEHLSIVCIGSNDLPGLLEAVLFAHIRFHDTVSRGRLLNRFGKDFEGFLASNFCAHSKLTPFPIIIGIDSSLADNFGRSSMYFISTIVRALLLFVMILFTPRRRRSSP